MKKIFLFIAVLVIFAACKNNKGRTTKFIREYGKDTVLGPNDSTTIQWDSTFINLGKMKRGEDVDIDYTFTNTGTKPLIIDSINVGCGCTLFKIPDHPVLPGEKDKISAKFVSSMQALAIHVKHIYIKANLLNSPYDTLAFKIELTEK